VAIDPPSRCAPGASQKARRFKRGYIPVSSSRSPGATGVSKHHEVDLFFMLYVLAAPPRRHSARDDIADAAILDPPCTEKDDASATAGRWWFLQSLRRRARRCSLEGIRGISGRCLLGRGSPEPVRSPLLGLECSTIAPTAARRRGIADGPSPKVPVAGPLYFACCPGDSARWWRADGPDPVPLQASRKALLRSMNLYAPAARRSRIRRRQG